MSEVSPYVIYLQIVSTTAAVFGVFIPLIFRWVEKKNKLKQSSELLELLHRYDEITKVLQQRRNDGHTPMPLIVRLEKIAKDLNKEINAANREIVAVRGFIYLIVVEIILVLSLIFSGLNTPLNKVVMGRSWENHLPFLEGILESPFSRTTLLMLIIALSVLTILKFSYLFERIIGSNKYLYNFVMLVFFNIIFLAITSLIASILLVIDNFVSFF